METDNLRHIEYFYVGVARIAPTTHQPQELNRYVQRSLDPVHFHVYYAASGRGSGDHGSFANAVLDRIEREQQFWIGVPAN